MIVGAIIQARTSSTRLPRKALLDVVGKSMLARVVDRVRRASTVERVVVATPSGRDDDALAQHAGSLGVDVYRGDEHDVLDRYYQAARLHRYDVVVRITSDCPLLDPGLLDDVVRPLLEPASRVDYSCNTLRRTYPRGLDVEAVPFGALERVWSEATSIHERAHVFPLIHEHPERFVTAGLTDAQDHSHMRWTVDTLEDLAFVREVYRVIGEREFCWRDVVALLGARPELLELNAFVQQKSAQDL